MVWGRACSGILSLQNIMCFCLGVVKSSSLLSRPVPYSATSIVFLLRTQCLRVQDASDVRGPGDCRYL